MDEMRAERVRRGLGSFIRVLHVMRSRGAAGIKPAPLDPQYIVLGMLGREPLPMSELSRRLECSKPNVTALVGRLIEEGLAGRKRDGKDRRIVRILITGKGKAALRQRRKAVRKAIRANLSHLDGKEIDSLCESLENVNRIIAGAGND